MRKKQKGRYITCPSSKNVKANGKLENTCYTVKAKILYINVSKGKFGMMVI